MLAKALLKENRQATLLLLALRAAIFLGNANLSLRRGTNGHVLEEPARHR